jgi:phage-Barnase-EndoU-ColicinE5/D-RelE like nuclease3
MNPKNIKQLVDIALRDGNLFAEFTFSKMPIAQSKIIENEIGIKLVGIHRVMDTSGIRHTLKNHGSEIDELKRGQIAVTIDDFNKIPQIVKYPDNIRYLGKNKLKQDVFEYEKRIGKIYFVSEAVKIAKVGNKLIFATLYKRKNKTQLKRKF